jgi:hypothetical protein
MKKIIAIASATSVAILAGCGTASHGASAGTRTNVPVVASSPSSDAMPVYNWYVTYARTPLNGLEKEFGQFSTDVTAVNLPAAQADCQVIENDASSMQALPPMPDPTLEQQWASALSNYQDGAIACIAGLTYESSTELQTASTDFTEGTTAIQTLTGDIANIS